MSAGVAQDQLRSFVRRVEALEDEIRALNADKSEVYKEAKGDGFDVKVLRKVIAARRMDSNERGEQESLFDLYWSAIHGAETGLVRAHVENIEEFDAETGEITEPQVAPRPAQADAQSVSSPSVENEGAAISTPIQPETANTDEPDAQTDGAGDFERDTVQSAPAQLTDGNIVADGLSRSAESHEPDATPAGAVVAETSGVTGGESAAPKYAAPGTTVMESCPPEGVVAHPYVACWPVNNIDVADGVNNPIVKIGNLILDGRGRYFSARGALIEYPVVQYAGTDPLMDCIRWNMASRPNLKGEPLRIIAHKLAKLEPDRTNAIYAAMGVETEVAA